MKALIKFFKGYISWLPLALFSIIVFGTIIYRYTFSTNASQANIEFESVNCQSICDGFMSCLQKIKDDSGFNGFIFQPEKINSACFSGCNKQKKLVSKCENLIIEQKCVEATLCLQQALHGK